MSFELSVLGWTSFFEEQWRRCSASNLVPARVAAEHRGAYEVWSNAGAGVARVSGGLRHELRERELPGVGDWVALDRAPGLDTTSTIELIFDRRTAFIRGAAGLRSRIQVVAANVDVVLVVCGLDDDFSLRRIERYVARVWASGALPLVVLSKADLVEDPWARLRQVETHAPGTEVVTTSVVREEGLAALRARIGTGTTAALVGSSGAGKSSLVNALAREEKMATGAVRSRDGRGCHVTTHRQLVLLPGGGLLLDTPGMRELQLCDDAGLEAAFEDIASLAEGCRFSDCSHGSEPGCAVAGAVAAGALDGSRLAHFRQLQVEAGAYERRHDARCSRMDDRAWGKQLREAKRQVRRWRG